MDWIRNNPAVAIFGGIVGVGILGFLAFGVFGIQTKFFDDEVAEALGVELLPLTPEALTAQTPWVRIIARARRARAQRDQQASRRRRRVNAAP